MNYYVVASESCFLDKAVERGEIVSTHTASHTAKEKAAKLNIRRLSSGKGQFVSVESDTPYRKGDIAVGLVEKHEADQRENLCMRLMEAILALELTGIPARMADDAGYYLQDLGLSIEELRAQYEPIVRKNHQDAIASRQAQAQKMPALMLRRRQSTRSEVNLASPFRLFEAFNRGRSITSLKFPIRSWPSFLFLTRSRYRLSCGLSAI